MLVESFLGADLRASWISRALTQGCQMSVVSF